MVLWRTTREENCADLQTQGLAQCLCLVPGLGIRLQLLLASFLELWCRASRREGEGEKAVQVARVSARKDVRHERTAARRENRVCC